MLMISGMKLVLASPFSKPFIPPCSLYQPIFHSASSLPIKHFQIPNLCRSIKPAIANSSPRTLVGSSSGQVRSLVNDASQSVSGEIHVIIGPMFAGKTTTLLRRIKSESSNGRSVAVLKSSKDTRFGLDSIVTHDGERLPCLPLDNLASLRQKLGHEAYDKLEVIGIDEAQFFSDLYEFCSQAADNEGKTVIVAGLDGDYLRRSFGSVLDIIPIADSVTKLTARCELCSKKAYFTLRKTDETKTELIAGADVYMPVCRSHYVSGQMVKEAAKTVLEAPRAGCSLLL